jgi:hypothetical protein
MGERHDEGGVWCKPNCPTHRAKERTPAERDTLRAEVVALTTERDAIAAQFDAYRARWNADQLPYKEMHDAAVARATAAEAERDALKKARPGCSPAPSGGYCVECGQETTRHDMSTGACPAPVVGLTEEERAEVEKRRTSKTKEWARMLDAETDDPLIAIIDRLTQGPTR